MVNAGDAWVSTMNTSRVDIGSAVLVAVVAAVISFIFYFLTLTQSVGGHDSAELALVAWQLGASHAPGSPIHAVLGHFVMQFYAEPHRGVTLLSAISASASAGFLALLIYTFKRDASVALFAALIYAFSYQVWSSAVMTELYSLSMLFLSIAMLNAWLWRISSKQLHFAVCIFAYALSLGAYFANILLIPAFAYLIYRASDQKIANLLTFSAATGLTVLIIGIANYFLAQKALPFGEIVPNSVMNMFLYMSGSQHNPLLVRDSAFILMRMDEHLGIFTRSLFYLGVPLGLLGAVSLSRTDKVFGHFLMLVFAIYVVYYTVFGPGDYFMMVLPAYFIYAIWVAFGVLWLISYARNRQLQWICRLLLVCIVAGLLVTQFNGRRFMAQSLDSEDFAKTTFSSLPHDAVAIAGWGEFTTLRYFQEVHGLRPDIRFLVPARSLRRYPYGEVSDYVDFVGNSICAAPVFSTKDLPELGDQYQLQTSPKDSKWMRVVGVSGSLPNFCQ